MMSYDVDSFNIESNLAISDIKFSLVIFFFDVMVSSWTWDRKARSPAAQPSNGSVLRWRFGLGGRSVGMGRECNEQTLQNGLLTSTE